MSDISLSFVFPAYNEGQRISRTIEQALEVARTSLNDFEIVVVNDGSKDNTAEVVRASQKKTPQIKLLNHLQNKGYGQTVWDGLKAASKDWVFFADSDLQFDLKEIERLLHHVGDYDVVIGYRAPRRDPFMRLVNAKVWNILNRIIFGLKVKDIDCAFKLFRRSVLADLEIKSGGAAFSAELMLKLQRQGHRFKEVPITHYPRQVGAGSTGAHPKVIIRAFREMLSMAREPGLVNPFLREAITFAFIGAIGTVFDYLFLNLGVLVFRVGIYWATFMGFAAGTLNNYLLNQVWTYRHLGRRPNFKNLTQFTAVGAAGLGITEGIMHVFTQKLGYNYNFSKLIAVIIIFFWNFFVNRYWTFAKKE